MVELRLLFHDGRPHRRDELLAVARRHGGSAKHYRAAVKRLKRAGYYLAPAGEYWAHRSTESETTLATQSAVLTRALPELSLRMRAERGERLRALLRGGDVAAHDAALALHESTLAALALCGGLSPSAAIFETYLTSEEEAAIKGETA